MARLWHVENVIEASEEGLVGLVGVDGLREDAKHLHRQLVLLYAIEVVQRSLCRPADVEGGGDVGACPVEDFGNLVPIGDILEWHVLDGCAGDDHTVELTGTQFLEIDVELLHVFYWRVLRGVRLEFHEGDVELQRRVGEQAYEVCLGGYLQGHEVEHDDLQRADVL